MTKTTGQPSESEDRYREFVQNISGGIWRFELEEPVPVDLPEEEQIDRFYRHSYLAECNAALARMYGVDRPEELIGSRLGDLLSRSHPANVEFLRAFVRSGYRLSQAESQDVDESGGARHYLDSLVGITEGGLLLRAWGTRRDVTERNAAEAALKRQADEMGLLYEAAGLLARTLDPDVVYDTMQTLIARVMDCDTLLVSSYTPEDNLIRCAYAWIEGQRTDAGQFPPIPLAPSGRGLQSRVIRTGEPLRIGDVPGETRALQRVHYVSPDGTVDDRPSADPMETRSLLMVPITLEGRVLGVAQVMSHRADAYSDGHLRIFQALMSQVAAASRNAYLYQQAREEIAERRRVEAEREAVLQENARLLRQSEAAAVQQRKFLREVLASLSEGRLHLCDSPDDLPEPLVAAGDPIALSGPTLQTFRAEVERVSRTQGLPDERWHDLLTAAGEASMNAVVHSGGGEGRVHAGPSGVVQIWVRDEGKGIAEEMLHRATLERGYTTAGTMGHGFWMMLKTADRIWLLTGPTGTTVVLEQERQEPEPFLPWESGG